MENHGVAFLEDFLFSRKVNNSCSVFNMHRQVGPANITWRDRFAYLRVLPFWFLRSGIWNAFGGFWKRLSFILRIGSPGSQHTPKSCSMNFWSIFT